MQAVTFGRLGGGVVAIWLDEALDVPHWYSEPVFDLLEDGEVFARLETGLG